MERSPEDQGIKSSFKNLEQHLSNFYKEKSSDNTSNQDKEEINITPEKYPQRENYRSVFSQRSEEDGISEFNIKRDIENLEEAFNELG